MAKRKIMIVTVVLLMLLQFAVFPSFAAGLDPYVGFDAWLISSYQCTQASFSKNGKLGGLWPGDWGCYSGLDFGSKSPYAVEIGVGVPEGYAKEVVLRMDAPDGPVVATVPITTGEWGVSVPCVAELSTQITGRHDIYISHSNSTSNIFSVRFLKEVDKSDDIIEYEERDAFTDISEDPNRRAINLLSQLGMLREYENQTFMPKMPLTRGEFAYSVFKLYGIQETEGAHRTKFSDVNGEKYYAQAIDFLASNGIISGVTENMFAPDDFIRHVDALVILCRILEYDNIAELNGGYPAGYLKTAGQQKLILAELGKDDFLRRTDMAALLYHAIYAESLAPVLVTSNGAVGYGKEQGILYKTQNWIHEKGKVVTTSITNLHMPESDLAEDEVVIDHAVYKTGKTDAAGLLGFRCEFFYSEIDGERILHGIIPLVSTEYSSINSRQNDIVSISNQKVVYYESDGKAEQTIRLSDAAVIYNGKAADSTPESLIDRPNSFCGAIKVIENSGGDRTVFIDEYVNYAVETIHAEEGFLKDKCTGKKWTFDEKKSKIIVKKGKDIISLGGIAEGDVVSVLESKNKTGDTYIRVLVSADQISGKITQKEEDTITVNGTVYYISPYCTDELTAGQTGVFSLDVHGEIVRYTYNESALSVGLYFAYDYNQAGLSNQVKIKMCTESGKTEIFTIAENATVDGLKPGNAAKAVNGTGTWEGLAKLKKETPVCFRLNAENEITLLDTILTGAENFNDRLKQLSPSRETYQYHRNLMTVGAIGRYYVPKTATLITFFGSQDKEDNCRILTLSDTIQSNDVMQGEVYSSFGDDYSGDIFVWRNYNESYRNTRYGAPFVFTETGKGINDKEEPIYLIKGYDGMTKVEYSLSEEDYDRSGIFQVVQKGDVLSATRKPDGSINDIRVEFFRDGAAAHGTVRSVVSENVRISGDSDRVRRLVYGKVLEKGETYIAVDVGSGTELVERSSESVSSLITRSDGTVHLITGMDSQSVSVGDVVFVYITSSGTQQIIICNENTL